MADQRTLEIYKRDLALMLGLYPKLDRATVYSWTYKISDEIAARQKKLYPSPHAAVRPEIPGPFWTRHALTHYRDASSFKELHLEHAIPRMVVINWLIDGDANNSCSANTRLDRAIELLTTTCWVTGDTSGQSQNVSEQSILNAKRYIPTHKDSGHIKNSMPPGWDVAVGDPWARYHAVKTRNENLGDEFLTVVHAREP